MERRLALKLFAILILSFQASGRPAHEMLSYADLGRNSDLSYFFLQKQKKESISFIKYSFGGIDGIHQISLKFIRDIKNSHNLLLEMHEKITPFIEKKAYNSLPHNKLLNIDERTSKKILDLYNHLTSANINLVYRSKICKMMVQRYKYHDHLFILSNKLGSYNNYILVSGPQGCWAPIHIAPAIEENRVYSEKLKLILKKLSRIKSSKN